MGKRLLVVDDEVKLTNLLREYLEQEDYSVRVAHDGKSALQILATEQVDLVVLDLMLPGMDGLEVCRAVRRQSNVPIIMLTARAEDVDRVVGLELGADDYVTKPFSLRELAARIRAVLRRTAGPDEAPDLATYGDLTIDFGGGEARLGGQLLPLTPMEFKVLAALARRPGRVLSRAQLLDAAMGSYYEGYERSIDTHVFNLRRKLEPDPARPRFLLTAHGLGYKFAVPGD